MTLYEKAWQDVNARVRRAAAAHGRSETPDGQPILLLAVSKSFPAEAIRGLYALGQRQFGENYAQEAVAKMTALADLPDLQWHLIGPLQTNKARIAAERFDWVHTVDRLKLARHLNDSRPPDLPRLNVCIQVNISGETTKSGVAPDAAMALAEELQQLPRLSLRGFMGIAEPTSDMLRRRSQFQLLAELLDAGRRQGMAMDTLSMGMSDDLEAAIAEGATLVRVGTALFGSRAAHSPVPDNA